jgi:hypothetical protein
MVIWAGAAVGQDVFSGNSGFPATYKSAVSTPPCNGNGSCIQIPGNVELNRCLRFVGATNDVCLCMDDATQQIWSEQDCDNVYEAGGEFFLGSGGGGGGPITNAVCGVTPYTIGAGGDDFWELCVDPGTDVPSLRAVCNGGDCPSTDIVVNPGQTLRFLDGGAPYLIHDPDAPLTVDRFKLQPGYEILLSKEVVLRPKLGTDCLVAEAEIVTDESVDEWITCADTVGDAVGFSFKITAKTSGVTAVKITMNARNDNGSPAGTFALQCAGQSVRPGIDTFVAHLTTGQQPVTFPAFTTTNQLEEASATFTLNGTVAAGAQIKGQCNISSAPAQMSDIRLHGTAVIQVLASSFSD